MIRSRLSFIVLCLLAFGPVVVSPRACAKTAPGRTWRVAQHNLLVTGCTVRNNNTKNFDRGWEAGAAPRTALDNAKPP